MERTCTKNSIMCNIGRSFTMCTIKFGVTPGQKNCLLAKHDPLICEINWSKTESVNLIRLTASHQPVITSSAHEVYLRTVPCQWKGNSTWCIWWNGQRSSDGCSNSWSWFWWHWCFSRIKAIKWSVLIA